MILTRKSHNCAGTAFVQGDSTGGSTLIEQTLCCGLLWFMVMFSYTFNVIKGINGQSATN